MSEDEQLDPIDEAFGSKEAPLPDRVMKSYTRVGRLRISPKSDQAMINAFDTVWRNGIGLTTLQQFRKEMEQFRLLFKQEMYVTILASALLKGALLRRYLEFDDALWVKWYCPEPYDRIGPAKNIAKHQYLCIRHLFNHLVKLSKKRKPWWVIKKRAECVIRYNHRCASRQSSS